MPSLGADMENGTVVEWLVKPGSRVRKGDVVAVVETQKGAIEVEIFEDGMIADLCVKEGEQVPVGAVLARLVAPGDTLAPAKPREARIEGDRAPVETAARPAAHVPVEEVMAAKARVGRVKVTPAARRRAGEIGIDPETLTGTGIEGSVTLADVEAVALPPAEARTATHKARRGFDPIEMRKAIAAAMSRSKREIPHYYLASTLDLGRTAAWWEAYNGQRSPDERLLPNVLLLKATALALREVPQLNGFWENGELRAEERIHVGWAISLRGGGLVAPAIHDTDRRSLPELMGLLRDLVGRARAGGLRSSELTNPTITVTSLGERGSDTVLGVIYPPQVAIVGFGRIVERPWVVDGRVTARPLVNLSLAGDHRASDGHAGGLLLSAIDRRMQRPEDL